MATKKAVKIAKKGRSKKTTKTTNLKKINESVNEKKTLTPEEERDLKAKQKVNELLKDTELLTLDPTTPIESANETDETVKLAGDANSVEWLEEQVTLLTQENEKLKEVNIQLTNELNNVGGTVKNNVIKVFTEIQELYIKLGKNPATGKPNLEIEPLAFLHRLIMFFPFLKEYKKI